MPGQVFSGHQGLRAVPVRPGWHKPVVARGGTTERMLKMRALAAVKASSPSRLCPQVDDDAFIRP